MFDLIRLLPHSCRFHVPLAVFHSIPSKLSLGVTGHGYNVSLIHSLSGDELMNGHLVPRHDNFAPHDEATHRQRTLYPGLQHTPASLEGSGLLGAAKANSSTANFVLLTCLGIRSDSFLPNSLCAASGKASIPVH